MRKKRFVVLVNRDNYLPDYRSASEDQNDGVLCIICNHNEPEELSSEMVFWIDCNVCGAWVHTYCAFGSIQSPTNLNVKIVSQIFLSGHFLFKIVKKKFSFFFLSIVAFFKSSFFENVENTF